MQFKVKKGTHVEMGVRYKEGDIVDSPYNLTTMFPQKFEAVQQEPVLPKPPPAPTAPASAPEAPARSPAGKKKAAPPPAQRDRFD